MTRNIKHCIPGLTRKLDFLYFWSFATADFDASANIHIFCKNSSNPNVLNQIENYISKIKTGQNKFVAKIRFKEICFIQIIEQSNEWIEIENFFDWIASTQSKSGGGIEVADYKKVTSLLGTIAPLTMVRDISNKV